VSSPVYTATPNIHLVFLRNAPLRRSCFWFIALEENEGLEILAFEASFSLVRYCLRSHRDSRQVLLLRWGSLPYRFSPSHWRRLGFPSLMILAWGFFHHRGLKSQCNRLLKVKFEFVVYTAFNLTSQDDDIARKHFILVNDHKIAHFDFSPRVPAKNKIGIAS
jgi:hypothetical protein